MSDILSNVEINLLVRLIQGFLVVQLLQDLQLVPWDPVDQCFQADLECLSYQPNPTIHPST